MTGPAVRPPQPWWVRPAIVLPIVGGLTLLVTLFAPVRVGPRSGDPRLSTYSTTPLGAGLLHELTQRLGWRTERRLRPELPPDPTVIHAVLAPAIPLRLGETHALLEHVRQGGAALLVVGSSTRSLLDSLHLRISDAGTAQPVELASGECRGRELPASISLWAGLPRQMLTLRWTAPPPGTVERFLESRAFLGLRGDSLMPSVIGFEYGRGRIVVSADADVVRNDAMRDCEAGFDVVAVRALEFLRAGGDRPRDLVVFDEYHQAHGAHPGTLSAVFLYLGRSPSGRLLAQLVVAGLLLLLALGPRTVPPRDDPRVERRSPLEQVDALARAYDQVGATRTAAQRLLRGVRRRTERAATRGRRTLDDAAWLAQVVTRHPAIADDAALVMRALDEAVPPRVFATLGPALHRIEATLTRT